MKRAGSALVTPCRSCIFYVTLRGVFHDTDTRVLDLRIWFSAMESLILAQNERWRHGLGMQVERDASGRPVAKG